MDNVAYVKMSRLVRLRDNAFRSNPLRLKRLEDVNLTIDFIPFGFSKNDLSGETATPCYL